MNSRSPACVATRGVVSAHLDGGASELELASAHHHLERCHECRRFHDAVVSITAELRDAPLVEAPGRVPTPVPVSAPRPARRSRSPRRRRFALQMTAAAAVVLFALVQSTTKLSDPVKPQRLGAETTLASFTPTQLEQLAQVRRAKGLPGAVVPQSWRIPGRLSL